MSRRRRISSALLLAAAMLSAGCHSAPPRAAIPETLRSGDCPAGTPALRATVEGRGPPLVMLGGVMTGAAGMAPVAGRLAAQRQVVRLQNHNVETAIAGAALPADYGVGTESCGMAAAIDRLGLQGPVDIVGYSYGGLIALDFALRQPGRVRSITLIEPPAQALLSEEKLRSPEQVRFAEAAMAVRRREPSDREAAAFVCIVFGCAAGDELERARQLPLWPAASQNRRALAGVYAVVDYRPPASVATLRVPLLYIEGAGTSAFHAAINARFRQLLPQARYVELPGGHAAPSVSSAALAAAILEFTAR